MFKNVREIQSRKETLDASAASCRRQRMNYDTITSSFTQHSDDDSAESARNIWRCSLTTCADSAAYVCDRDINCELIDAPPTHSIHCVTSTCIISE